MTPIAYVALAYAILMCTNKLHFYITKREYDLEEENAFIPYIFFVAIYLLILLLHAIYLRYFAR